MSPRTLVLAALLASLTAATVDAAGRYSRRQGARGELTDTSAKATRYGFMNDREETPRRLALYVDAAAARSDTPHRYLQVRYGLDFRGRGPDLWLGPESFVLTWPGAKAPLAPLSHREWRARLAEEGPRLARTLRAQRRMGRLRSVGSLYELLRGHPASGGFFLPDGPAGHAHRAVVMDPGSRHVGWLMFELPEGVERWETLFELRLREDDAELVDVRFRVERDPTLHRTAFRRARKARRIENRREKRDRRRQVEPLEVSAVSR